MSESEKVFLKVYEGVRLYVDREGGRFHADLGEEAVVRPSLAELEELIRRWKQPVKALWFPTGVSVANLLPDPVVLGIVGGDEQRWLTSSGGELRRAMGQVVRYNDTRLAAARLEVGVLRARVEDVLLDWQRWLETMPELRRADTGWEEGR